MMKLNKFFNRFDQPTASPHPPLPSILKPNIIKSSNPTSQPPPNIMDFPSSSSSSSHPIRPRQSVSTRLKTCAAELGAWILKSSCIVLVPKKKDLWPVALTSDEDSVAALPQPPQDPLQFAYTADVGLEDAIPEPPTPSPLAHM